MDKLSLPYQIVAKWCPYGNHLGVISFIWKVPDDSVDQSQIGRQITKLNKRQSVFATSQMRRDFLDQYSLHVKCPKSVLCHMYRTLINDCSGPSNESKREVDERVAEALESYMIQYDIRILNGNVKLSKHDPFWDELTVYLEELTPAVDERRHSDTPHTPVAVSLSHLMDLVKERLKKKYPDDEYKLWWP